eukprot:TRINITY_DN400_c0_g5_i2.p1 TRINITY_DN400_c0_g5~~TRINITY_DN400_c0_g5_i2.p1  ORF type:complete len:728 (-),score=156.17 TRINITY_DN400_c0_g5_i2:2823-4910(-)
MERSSAFFVVFFALALGTLCACIPHNDQHAFSVDDMVSFLRVSDPAVSPDEELFITSVRKWDRNTGVASFNLYCAATDGTTGSLALTSDTSGANSDVAWFPSSSEKIFAYLSTRSGSSQVWMMNMDTKAHQQVTTFPVSVSNLKWSPKGQYLLFTAEVYPGCNMQQTADKDKEKATERTTGKTFDQLYIRHWNVMFEGKWQHVFSVPVTRSGDLFTVQVSKAVDLMYGMNGDCPVKPFDGPDDFNVSPDDSEVAFTTQLGKDVAWTTDLNVYTVPIGGGSDPQCITCDNKGKDMQPGYSPDGKYMAFIRLVQPVSESDRARLMIRDRSSGKIWEAVTTLDRSFGGFLWETQDTILGIIDDSARERIVRISVSQSSVKMVMPDHTNSGIQVLGKKGVIIYAQNSMTAPTEIFSMYRDGSNATQLTFFNRELLQSVYVSIPEEFFYTGSRGDQVQGWVLKPYGFDPAKKYPMALFIHGGPEGSWNDGFSYRWNEQAFSGAGYVLVAINPHGSTGFGMNYTWDIYENWGGDPYQDLMMGVDYVISKYPYIDETRIGALGASYGGYMINWINGHTNRFKCLVFHDGIFDLESFYYSTEELFFPEREMGGPPFDTTTYYNKWTPMNFVQNWQTPTLVVHSEKDYRIPLAQGIATFSALQRQGVPSRMVFFPDECHWVTNPDNSIYWHQNVIGWLDEWLQE